VGTRTQTGRAINGGGNVQIDRVLNYKINFQLYKLCKTGFRSIYILNSLLCTCQLLKYRNTVHVIKVMTKTKLQYNLFLAPIAFIASSRRSLWVCVHERFSYFTHVDVVDVDVVVVGRLLMSFVDAVYTLLLLLSFWLLLLLFSLSVDLPSACFKCATKLTDGEGSLSLLLASLKGFLRMPGEEGVEEAEIGVAGSRGVVTGTMWDNVLLLLGL